MISFGKPIKRVWFSTKTNGKNYRWKEKEIKMEEEKIMYVVRVGRRWGTNNGWVK